MSKITAFFKLIRWPNLLMIILSQVLLQYMLITHVFSLIHIDSPLSHWQFFLLMMSTVFMAAYGYAFNDVQDVTIDTINKDHKRIIEKSISRKSGLRIAWVSLFFSFLPAIYLAFTLQMLQLIAIHLFIAFGLWYYSTDLKKQILSGNIIISLFTAFSISIVWLYHLVAIHNNPTAIIDGQSVIPFINQLILGLSFFAFIISFIREIIKDLEDIEGDKKRDLKTFPIVYGLKKSKLLIISLSLIMIVSTAYAAYYSYAHHLLKVSIYLLIAVGIPLIYLISNLLKSRTKDDFSDLSTLAKIVMVAGILSIQIFYINY